MGNAESGCGAGSGDEEDVETESPVFGEGSPASAATGNRAGGGAAGGGGGGGSGGGEVGGGGGGYGGGGGGSGPARNGRGSTNPPAPSYGLPTPEALLEQVKLREAAARMNDSWVAISESVLARNESALVRWLEERLSRGEESVTLEQFCEMLESRDAPRDECEEAFGQFDAEGDGIVDVENMLMALKNSNGANLQGELSHVIRQLQACSLTPGFVDIFSKSKDRLKAHASKILKFLHRNRIPSSAIPFPVLEGYNSICTMRSSVVQDFLDYLLQKEKDLDIQYRAELNHDPDVDKVKVVTQCYSFIDASSNSADIHKLTNGETVSFWQSDGSARSHWIRLKMKPDIVLRRLAIAVASNDHSYMPQLVSVAVGKNRRSLQEIRDVRIPSNITGYVPLLDNANITHPYIQINIKRCLSDGCDTRIHGLKTMGYQITKSKEVSVSDASAIWYLSLLTSLVTASMETNPVLAQTVLQSTQKALQHMPPLSLTASSTEFPKFFSANILEEVDGFLLRIADCCVSPEAELTLLAFALARGSVAKVLISLSGICEHMDSEYRASSLLASMVSVRLRLLYRNGKPLQLHLQACDVKSKEEKSGPENMLTEPNTGDGFLTENGKRKASVILSTEDQSCFQVTQIKIKVRKGAIGAKCGLVYAYNDSEAFDADKHFKRFKKYDSWDYKDYKVFVQDSTKIPKTSEEEPIGWFEVEEDWNNVEIKLQQCRVSKFLMVKFLCARQDTAERLGIQQMSFSGYLCPDSERLDDVEDLSTQAEGSVSGLVTGLTLMKKTLYFIQQLTRDMDVSFSKQKSHLDFSDLNLLLFWDFYRKLRSFEGEEAVKTRVLLLQLLQNCFPMLPSLTESQPSDVTASSSASASASTHVDPAEAVGELYCYLCQVVDGPEGETAVEKALRKEAVKAILSGAAIFFPVKKSRRDKLFHMMKNITEENQPESVKLTFESLCNYFSDQDPRGLLLLPPTGAPSDFNISPILTVMDTLLVVATSECEVLMMDSSGGSIWRVLLSLFWALQGSLLSWCFLQLKGGTATSAELAREILLKYVEQFLVGTRDILSSLINRFSGADIMDKLSKSILAITTRQLTIFLLELCALDIPHCVLLKRFYPLADLLKKLSSDTEDIFSKVDMEGCQQMQQPVVLRTWQMESPHNYENSRHETTVFVCPGASSFEVEFDERSETEKRYDYLEFTDARGGKVRYDMKVGTEKWPKKVTFKAGPQLQFLFHSDSSNNEWGYKFTVTAYGLPDITVSWTSDMQLLVSRLMGRLASRTMALKSPYEIRGVKELPAGIMNHVLSSPLWKPLFRHGLSGFSSGGILALSSLENGQESSAPLKDDLVEFLMEFACWDPSQDSSDGRAELMRTLMMALKKQPVRNEIAAGCKVDQAVNATWAAMVYHTPAFHHCLRSFVAKNGQSSLSDDLMQVFTLADGIKTWMLEMKQRYLVAKMNGLEEKEEGQNEVTMESLAEICISRSLFLFRFSSGGSSSPPEPSRAEEGACAGPLLRSVSTSEGDFHPSHSPSISLAPEGAEAATPLGTALHDQAFSASADVGHSSIVCAQGATGSSESLQSQIEQPVSPLVFPRKASFSRGCLRLLSFRSMEEPRVVPHVKERFPILKHILCFMKDMVISENSVLHTLALKKAQALSVCEVLEIVQQCILTLGKPHLFQAPCILFLQELLACQKDFTNYFSQLAGSGQEMRELVRHWYHRLVLMLVEAVQGFNALNEKVLLPALSCVQTCLLHLLDMSWESKDLPLFLDIKLPDLLLTMSQENISVHDIAISQWTEEDEIADYERNCEWMDECLDGMFEKWFDKISQASLEEKRKMHMFIARYCDLLNVEISCDGCERIAPWHRYRCLQCTDMDLCKTCFLSGAKPEGHEDDHEMVNMEYACDHCQGLIVGSRINCNVCEDFDLCFGCYNAKKYPDSHLPTHRITVYPMVTIRISDRHRLIQPYIHNYSWLLFAALTLFTSELVSEKEQQGELLDDVTLSYASALQTHCSDLINECLLKGQTGKGLRASVLLSLLSSNESATESELCPVTPGSSQDISSTDTLSLPSSTTAICSPLPPSDGKPQKQDMGAEGDERSKLVSQDTLDSSSASQTPTSEDTMSPAVRASESSGDTIKSPTSENMDIYKDTEEKTARGPLQEHVFAECSRERILGLLAAMLPAAKLGSTLSLSSLSPILPLLFRVVISNAGCLNETYHLTLGLLGQLLLRISPAEADAAVAEALTDKFELLALGEGATFDVQGWKTTQLLFSLGAVCLDSRIGLDWACSVADILQNLNVCPQWCVVVAAFTDHCIQQLPQHLKRTNLFTLLVLVGFPEVLCMGTQAVFIDNANEQHNMILLKHFTEKNRAAVVDVKTRKRRTVKDYQLVQAHECSKNSNAEGQSEGQAVCPTSSHLSRYLRNFTSILSHLLQVGVESSAQDAVEATWVLSLALKGLYNTLKKHGVDQAQEAIQGSGLMQLLVRKCSKGTGFSKMWLLRDLEILSIMLYSSKREIHSMAEDGDTETDGEREKEKEHDSDHSSCCADDADPNRPDPLEGLDEETKICFQITHDALNAPLHILRAMYELQMKRTDSFFLEVQKRFDGDAIKTDETIRTLAQKWQPSKRPRSEERNAKAVDTDIIIVPCVSKPTRCERATEETNVVTQKLITNTESDLQLSYAKQRRTKSSALLHKELDARSNKAVRQYLFKVNEAIAILYARHVLATLLADWPSDTPIREEDLELSGASHMAYILDMLMQLEERPMWEKILQKVLRGCSQSMLGNLSLTACQFMEEPGMAVQVRESKHPYDNNTNFEDKVHIPGAIFLSVKFDSRCHTEEGCDELLMASSSDFLQDLHTFSGSHQKWTDFEIPGDTLYYRFISDMSNTEWGYKFTVTGGHRGRFQTGFEILKQMLADELALTHLPLSDIWEWQVGVACRQTGNQRLKAIHLLLRLLQCQSQWGCDLTLLRPLWQLFSTMESGLSQDPTSITVLLPLHRALTELFFIAEAKAMDQGILQQYLLALTTNEQLVVRTTQALKNIAAISLAINYPNKSTKQLTLTP
ncbi:zinc finger ZZ-type and EF-hand domain-containing protein 1-like isoform X2 [Xyrauchen texanus]|uniref:zinc finger ZZ-type and EF-hand domain-containing protein 1-like isoform X2 n=1 Tax=Xyrauchen texanus TaxID=154827 RepID=UPI002242BB81|nr:zinc finger ZZ-type and EF-hand domain-containing protein 1-like isoform X2 [Xyrauchen texanus]